MPRTTRGAEGYTFTPTDDGDQRTAVDFRLRITDSAIKSAEFIAGTELGWTESLDKLVDAIASEKE